MTPTRFAFIKADVHSEVVGQALAGFLQIIPAKQVDTFDVPGSLELPLLAKKLARTKKYAAIAAAGLIVDGGIYRHDFVAQAVVSGLLQVSLETDIPVLSVALTPHNYQEGDHHSRIYAEHFVLKGREAGEAAVQAAKLHAELA